MGVTPTRRRRFLLMGPSLVLGFLPLVAPAPAGSAGMAPATETPTPTDAAIGATVTASPAPPAVPSPRETGTATTTPAVAATVIAPPSIPAAATALPARTAPAGARLVFLERFERDNLRGWNEQTTSDGSSTSVGRGQLRIVRAAPGTMRSWPLRAQVPRGVRFNARLTIAAGTYPYAGITLRDDLGANFVLFAITPDGKAGLFGHTALGYQVLVPWRPQPSLHQGLRAINTLSVDLDAASAAAGRTMLINGVPLGKPGVDMWRAALDVAPAPALGGLFVGVLAGSYAGTTRVDLLAASMYDATRAGPGPGCGSGGR